MEDFDKSLPKQITKNPEKQKQKIRQGNIQEFKVRIA